MRDDIGDQTRFSTEEPFLEDPNLIPAEPKAYVPPVPFLKRRKTIVGIILLLIVLGLGTLFGYAKYVEWLRRIQEPPVVAGPTLPSVTFTELAQEAEALSRELTLADPEERALVFPTIDAGIRMEARPR